MSIVQQNQQLYSEQIQHLKESLDDILTNLVPALELADAQNTGLYNNVGDGSDYGYLRTTVDNLKTTVDAD